MEYILNDGNRINAFDNEDFVRKLNAESRFAYHPDIKAFMKDTAQRCLVQTGKKVRIDDFDVFVSDLNKAGLIREII